MVSVPVLWEERDSPKEGEDGQEWGVARLAEGGVVARRRCVWELWDSGSFLLMAPGLLKATLEEGS